MRRVSSLLFAMFLIYIGAFAQEVSLKKFHRQYVGEKYLSYKTKEIYYTTNGDTSVSIYAIMQKNDKNNSIVSVIENNNQCIKLDNKQIIIITNDNEELACYNKVFVNGFENNYEFYSYQWLKTKQDWNIYSPYWEKKNGKRINSTDSLINGVTYKILQCQSPISTTWFAHENYQQAQKNKTYWYSQYNIFYYYNTSIKRIDKIVFIPIDTVKGVVSKTDINRIVYEFSDFSIDNNTLIIDSIYNLNNAAYATYLRLNDNKPSIYCDKEINEMNKEILNFPLVDIDNDTTTIAKEKGWLLLDCWFRGCPPCLKFFERMNKERSENDGKTILELKSIKIMSINPYSADIKRLKQDAIKYHCEPYFYGAKGLNSYLKMYPMPQYYLISPDKKIVYSHIGDDIDYKDILKAINDYE